MSKEVDEYLTKGGAITKLPPGVADVECIRYSKRRAMTESKAFKFYTRK